MVSVRANRAGGTAEGGGRGRESFSQKLGGGGRCIRRCLSQQPEDKVRPAIPRDTVDDSGPIGARAGGHSSGNRFRPGLIPAEGGDEVCTLSHGESRGPIPAKPGHFERFQPLRHKKT